MKLTLFTFGTWGDVRPLVVLGIGLQAAGHDVQVVFSALYNRFSYRFVQRMAWMLLAAPRNALRKQHPGSTKHSLREFQAVLAATPALTVVSPHVVARPADWAEHQHVTGYLFDDDPAWTPPPDLSAFLAAGEPPVYIGFGSMPDSKPQTTTRLLIDAVRQAGKRAVILTGWAGIGAADLPESIHLLSYAPHSWLFPQMAAVVHHGGAGTTASGFRAGVPAVIVPHNADQPFWGRRAQELGVGTEPIPRGRLTAGKLAAAIVEATTNPSMQFKAAELSRKIAAEDGTGEAVKVIGAILDGSSSSRFG